AAADECRQQRGHGEPGLFRDGLVDEQPRRRTHAERPREPRGHAEGRRPGPGRRGRRDPSHEVEGAAKPPVMGGEGRLAEQEPPEELRHVVLLTVGELTPHQLLDGPPPAPPPPPPPGPRVLRAPPPRRPGRTGAGAASLRGWRVGGRDAGTRPP